MLLPTQVAGSYVTRMLGMNLIALGSDAACHGKVNDANEAVDQVWHQCGASGNRQSAMTTTTSSALSANSHGDAGRSYCHA